jgi:hypothetical protein
VPRPRVCHPFLCSLLRQLSLDGSSLHDGGMDALCALEGLTALSLDSCNLQWLPGGAYLWGMRRWGRPAGWLVVGWRLERA